MTTRPGNGALALWSSKGHRTKRPCNLVHLTRTDGVILRVTDHDTPVTFEGQTYVPAVFAGMSAERREGALRTGDQNVYGVIDGTTVQIPDLMADRYRGAEVAHVVTDWSAPWLPIARFRKWVRVVHWTGSTFVGVLEGRAQVLSRPTGGRFGGIWTTTCPYRLGDAATCKASITPSAGVRVQTIHDDRWDVSMVVATWGTSGPDDYYRDGEIEWRWAAPAVERQCSATTTSTTLTDAGAGMTVNAHVGKWVRVLNASGGYVQGTSYARITANTATTITYATQANMAGFASGTWYDICAECANAGIVSPIVRYVHSTRRIELLFPTPFDIAVGDSGIVKPGCDGLFTTCSTKFSKSLDFGGDHLAPSAGRVAEPPGEQ